MTEKKPFQRLSTAVEPKNYSVTLQPDLIKCVFKGAVEIDIKICKPIMCIELNCLDLKIDVAILIVNGKTIIPENLAMDVYTEVIYLTFSNPLEVGDAILKFEYNGTLNDKIKGFYRSKYYLGSELCYAAVTQFEATDARRCFPCWDEPALKAYFDMTLIVAADKVALSNMNELSRDVYEADKTLHVLKFAKSPLMSTYLLAVAVGDFDFVENVLPNGVTIRVYTPVGKKAHGEFALEAATKMLPYYHEYFDIEYPLPKLDLIAIADGSGAMENWGLITYCDTMLLVDVDNTSAGNRQNIATVVAHELAHQWFGNLVTLEWWTDLWLNEGYATFCEYLCVSQLFPEYSMWTQFASGALASAMHEDALRNSHPIQVEVGHPAEIGEIFDDISYSKGAVVIRMIYHYIGEENFRKGMQLYLRRHKFKNTRTIDLWQALSEVSGKPVAKIMSNWTEKTGFPVVEVTSEQKGDDRILKLKQRRFLANGDNDTEGTEWIVPMSFATSSHGTAVANYVLEGKEGEVTLPGVKPKDWVKLNVSSVSLFRTRYPTQMLEKLGPAIASKSLPTLDRLGVVDDLFSMVQAGLSSIADALRFLSFYENEDEYVVWSAIHKVVSELNLLFSNTNFQPLFTTFVKKLFSKIAAKLGWNAKKGETHFHTLLRSMVLRRLGLSHDDAVVSESRRRLDSHFSGKCMVPADLRTAVYTAVMRQADENTFHKMIKLYHATELREEKRRIALALGASVKPDIIKKVIEFAISDDVRPNDSVFVITSVVHCAAGRNAAWNMLKEHLDDYIAKYVDGFLLTHLIKGVASSFASELAATEIESTFSRRPVVSAERTVRQAVETVRLNAAWLSRDGEEAKMFLQKAAQEK